MKCRSSKPSERTVAFGLLLALAGVATAAATATGCGNDAKDYFVVQYDAGSDADEGGAAEAGPELDPTLGGPCTDDAQCDDLIACTFDQCDKSLSRCRNTPDDTQCSDQQYCNGQERCVLRQGCVAGPVVTCDDNDGCTIDRCVEATKSCEHTLRDTDQDGDPDDHCAPHHDCDDTDPTVSSTHAEVCGNSKDDNCDGQIDEQPCSTSANDTCATAFPVSAPGTFLLNTIAAVKDYTTSCTVLSPSSARDIVLAITVPAGDPKDVVVRARTSQPPTDVAVALQGACGNAGSELSCGNVTNVGDSRTIARSVAGGTTVYAIVTTQAESAVDVTVDMPPGTTKPANESCTAPKAIALDTPFTVSLVDAAKDLASDCNAMTGELTYSFTLAQPQDVHVYTSTLLGNGQAVVSLRQPDCTDELRCRVGSAPALYARLQAGMYVLSVAGTAQIDASILVKTSPATPPPLNGSCSTAPLLTPNAPLIVDLSAQEGAIKNGCFPGSPNAAYELDLAQASDVLVLGRFGQGDVGAVSLDLPGCGAGDLLGCSLGATPERLSLRNVTAGSYRVVIADQNAQSTELSALVRPTVPPVTVTSDDCTSPQVIPETGGFFTGDTTNAKADFSAGCDATGQPIGGAKDQMLKLVLTQQRRVVFDMSGSANTTLLSVRSGVTCPGTEVPNGCNPGNTSPNRSFLDLTLDAGTYWIQVDGYSGAVGQWNLDVRVLPP